MKVILSSMNFVAPPNLMTLYTSGHISKNQLLNLLRLDSQRWYSPFIPNPGSSPAFPIDLTDGTDSDNPIIIIDDPSHNHD